MTHSARTPSIVHDRTEASHVSSASGTRRHGEVGCAHPTKANRRVGIAHLARAVMRDHHHPCATASMHRMFPARRPFAPGRAGPTRPGSDGAARTARLEKRGGQSTPAKSVTRPALSASGLVFDVERAQG